MATEITTIQGKGAPLNATELDDNFINLRDAVDGVIGGTQITESINLDTTPTVPTGEGKLYWDSEDGTLAINMAGGIVKQQVGLETYFKVRNVTGTTIPNGTPVMATGVVSGTDRLQVTPAIANGTIQSVRFIGLVTEPLNNSSNGYSTCFGFVRDVNTTGSSVGETWAIGDLLYISQTTAGKLTKVAPTSGLKILAAIVVTVNATTGILLTRATPGVIIEDVYFKAEVDTKLAEKMSTASYTGAIGNITSPLLHLPLKNSLAFSQGVGSVSFERTSTATYVDRYGMLKSVAADVPRFTSDGLLIEGASTNLLIYSEQFDDVSWLKARCSISANTANTTDPFGTNSADIIVEDSTASSSHSVYKSAPLTSGITYAVSIFAKAKERTQIKISTDHGAQATFNLSNGTVVSTGGGVLSAAITPCANGWYRCYITYTATSTGSQGQYFGIAVNGTAVYTGDGTSGLYIFGAQLEAMPFVTSYIPTTSTSATRTANNFSIPQAENLPAHSGSFSYALDFVYNGQSTGNLDFLFGDGTTDFRAFIQSNTLRVNINNIQLTAGISPNTKYRMILVGGSTTLYLYLNGIMAASGAMGGKVSNKTNLYIGSYSGTANHLFGTISNLRIYDRALTAEEVRLA